jgi:pectate lyase/pectin methylesterase-like acyl-CoA thioesterase
MKRFLMVLIAGLLPLAALASPLQPQISAATTAQHRAADYLALGPAPWQPADVDARRFKPDFIVATDGSGTHRSVQAAVDALPARASEGEGARRWFIQLRPGIYRGPLCVQGKPPLTLYGTPGRAGGATLVDGRYNGLPKRPGVEAAQPCHSNLAAATHGTSGSATAIIDSADVLLAHLTIANDATEIGSPEKSIPREGAQAVALLTRADRVQLEDVRLRSHQDTFYVRRPARDEPARVFVRGSVIEGDVDFVFGNAILVIDDSTLVSRAGRLGSAGGGYVLAPSTPANAALGFLVQRSRFVAETGVPAGSTHLGRAWDEGVPPGQWQPGVSPNGQALVRDSGLGPHLAHTAARWAASTSRRPFTAAAFPGDATANRFAEHDNTALPSDISREVLPPGQGWAAMEGGTRGGADAAAADVHWARNRAELAAALKPHASAVQRPRIVKLIGRIDLSVDNAGRPLSAEDFRDPDFNWPAYAAAYDPATWGRQQPAGPLEDARSASARRQAAHVVLQVPSRTTLIGIGPDAHIVNGGLALNQVSDVIVRNIRFSDAFDHFPAWDPKDNAQGEWNSEYDNLLLRGASRIWVDHCTFDDGDRPDANAATLLGRRMQHHDGLLDITRGASFITVSWNHFAQHDKTSLVGGSDRHTEDEGRLKLSFHHNLWEQTRERSPRVRFGQVHLFNNLHLVHEASAFGYSIGVGHRADVLSQHNVWDVPPELNATRLVRRLGTGLLHDEGSLMNGQPVALSDNAASWLPPYALRPDPAHQAAARVRAGSGAGRLWTPSPPSLPAKGP